MGNRLLRFFYDLDQTPALGSTQWARFNNTDEIADSASIVFVMRMEFLPPLNEFAIDRVTEFTLYHDRDGLIIFVARDQAYPLLFQRVIGGAYYFFITHFSCVI